MPLTLTAHQRRERIHTAMFTPTFSIVIGWLAVQASAAAIVILANEPVVIWTEAQLRAVCALGAGLGGLLSIAIFPECLRWKDGDTVGSMARRVAFQGTTSTVFGILFTPAFVRWIGWGINADIVLAVSGGMASLFIVAVGVINLVVPVVNRWAARRAAKLLGEESSVVRRRQDSEPPKSP